MPWGLHLAYLFLTFLCARAQGAQLLKALNAVGATEAKDVISQPICAFAASKLAASFPAMVPPGSPSPAINQLLAQYNDLTAQLLIACLGMSHGSHEASTIDNMPRSNNQEVDGQATDQLALSAAGSSNAYASFSAAAAARAQPSVPASWPSTRTEAKEQKAMQKEPTWLQTLLLFCRDVLHENIAVKAPECLAATSRDIPASAALFGTALSGLEASMAVVRSQYSSSSSCIS